MSQSTRQATKIMLIRHAEKPTPDPPPYGVTEDGEREKESLTVRGWQRAGALVGLFSQLNDSSQDYGLARPQFLYASKFVKRNGSKRAIETLTPLAEKLAIRINFNYQKDEFGEMLEEVFLCAGVVLISWQHDFLPKLANYILGNKNIAPQEWPEDRFDMVWVFDRDAATSKYGFRQVPQSLLMGDWATPIK